MKSSDKIYGLMQAVRADAAMLTGSDLDAMHTQLQAVIGKQGLLCFPFVLATHHTNTSVRNGDMTSATTVDVEFTFTAEDGSSLAARTTGIHVDTLPVVNNYALLQARKHALLSVFGLSVEVAAAHTKADAVMASLIDVAKGLTTADKVAPPKAKPEIPPVRPAASNLPATPSLTTPPAMSPAAQAVADWMSGIDALNPEAPGEWDVHRLALKTLVLTDVERLDLFKKLQEAGWNLGVDYHPTRKMFFLAEPATTDN